jgi:hypothetical protein
VPVFQNCTTFSPETAVGVHGFSVFFSWQFHFDKTADTAVGRWILTAFEITSSIR